MRKFSAQFERVAKMNETIVDRFVFPQLNPTSREQDVKKRGIGLFGWRPLMNRGVFPSDVTRHLLRLLTMRRIQGLFAVFGEGNFSPAWGGS